MEENEKRLQAEFGNVEIFAFGHLGDGNLHYAVAEPANASTPIVRQNAEAITERVHEHVTSLGGSISAEHGIGLLKRHELPNRHDPFDSQLKQTRSIEGLSLVFLPSGMLLLLVAAILLCC